MYICIYIYIKMPTYQMHNYRLTCWEVGNAFRPTKFPRQALPQEVVRLLTEMKNRSTRLSSA